FVGTREQKLFGFRIPAPARCFGTRKMARNAAQRPIERPKASLEPHLDVVAACRFADHIQLGRRGLANQLGANEIDPEASRAAFWFGKVYHTQPRDPFAFLEARRR